MGDLSFIQLVNILAPVESLTAAFKRAAGDPFQSVLQRPGTQRAVAGEEPESALFTLCVQRSINLLPLVTVGEMAPPETHEAVDSHLPRCQVPCVAWAVAEDRQQGVVPVDVLRVGENAPPQHREVDRCAVVVEDAHTVETALQSER